MSTYRVGQVLGRHLYDVAFIAQVHPTNKGALAPTYYYNLETVLTFQVQTLLESDLLKISPNLTKLSFILFVQGCN